MDSGRFGDAEIGEDPVPDTEFCAEWLRELEARFGEMNFVRSVRSPGKPLIHVFYFDGLPEPGCLTAITCGLSAARHPDWTAGCPEVIVTLESRDTTWGLGAGYFASAFFGERRFSYGDIFKVDHPISHDGAMDAFLVFAPSFLNREQAKFVLSDRTIFLTGLYPIYGEEIPIYDRIGLKAFWHADGFEMYNPKRGPVRIAKN